MDPAHPRRRVAKARARGFDAKWLIIGAAVLIVAWLALVPLVFLLWQSFMTPLSPGMPALFTLANYANVYASAETFRLLGNSLAFASGAATLSLFIGTALAWMNERTNTPFKSLIYALSVVPLIIPGILFVAAWIMLASPKIGVLNLLLQRAFGTDHVFFDVYTLPGMMWVDGIQHAPIAFLLMSAALRSMDPSLEESALLSGASIFQVARRITLRLTFPALAASFLILFVRSIESFENPALLGLPVGIQVFTSSIYEALHAYPSDVGLASTYAVTLLVITSGGIYWQSRLARQGSRYATVSGKSFRPRVMDLGRWRYLAGAFFVLYAALVIGLPFLVLVWSSLQRFYSVPSLAALQNISLFNYRAVLDYPSIGTAVWNSILLAFATATGVMALSAVIGWLVLRTRIPGRWILDNIASLPMVMPGLVIGLAIMISYLALGGGHLRHDLDSADRLYDALSSLWHAFQRRLLVAAPQGAGGIRAKLRRELVHHFPPHRAAAAQARPDGRLDLYRHRLDPRAFQFRAALQPRHRGGVGGAVGDVAERPICAALRPWRDDDRRALRVRAGRANVRPPVWRQGGLTC